MKKFTSKKWLLLMMIFIIAISNPVIGQKQYDPDKLFSVDQLREDFLFTKKALEKYHPGLYWYVDKESFDAFSDSLFATIDHPMTEIELYNLILPMFQIVREKHADVFLSDKGYQWFKNEVKRFPFSLKCIDDRLFIDKNGSSDTTLLRGTELVEINGRSSESIVDEMKQRLISDGYNTTGIVRYDIEDEFHYHYYLNIAQTEEFELRLKRVGEDVLDSVKVSGEPRTVYNTRILEGKELGAKYPIRFEVLDSLNTAIFTLNTFSRGKETNELGLSIFSFTERVFEQLQSMPQVENLIIDVRQNEGGIPGAEISMLTYLTDRKNKVYKRVERNSWDIFFRKDGTGKYFSEKFLGYTMEPKEERFTGQVYLLIGGKTYSAASAFSVSLANFTNAIVIGEETGGGYYGTTGGSWKKTFTPNVKLDLRIPKMRFLLNVSGQPEGYGVLPDHQIVSTYNDFLQEKDAEMEYTFGLIRQGASVNSVSR